MWRGSRFSDLNILEIKYHDNVTIFSARTFFFHLAKQNKCASVRFCARERPEFFFYYHWRRKLCGPGPYTNKYTNGIFWSVILVVSIFTLRVYITFLLLGNIIDRINSYFQRIAFYRNLLLIGL